MKTKVLAAAALTLGATAALASPAHAVSTGECQALIAVLSADTATARSLSVKSSSGLVDKADAAATKLDSGKVSDALAKLTDYDSSLDALHSAVKPKVSDEDFALLNGDVEAAMECVVSIGTP